MACEELFEAMDLKEVKVEDDLSMSTSSFLTDFIHMIDEIKGPSDIVQLWHVDGTIADQMYDVMQEVICCEDEYQARGVDDVSDGVEDEFDEEDLDETASVCESLSEDAEYDDDDE